MKDLLKCPAISLLFYVNMLAVLLCWKMAVVLIAPKERFVGIFPLQSVLLALSFGALFAFIWRGWSEAETY